MDISWNCLTSSGPIGCKARGMTSYYYSGDINPYDHSGAWVNPDTGHAIRILGRADTWQDEKGRDVCVVDSLELICRGRKSIRESLACIGQDVADWLGMPRDQRRAVLCFALLAYGHCDPANEVPDWHEVVTHRESAAFRAVNNFMR